MKSENEYTIDSKVKYSSVNIIGKGAWSIIYQGHDIETNHLVAVKAESAKTRYPQLEHEGNILKILEGGIGIPQLIKYHHGNTNNYLIIQLLGKSIERLFDLSNRNFPLATVLQIGNQILERVEYIHSHHLIHRDIKPDNFLIGRSDKDREMIYLIDYGLARYYEDPQTLSHMPYKNGKSLIGTARYGSIYALLGVEQSRRDDLESIGYMLVYLIKGLLPWQGLKAKNKNDKYRKIREKKLTLSPEELCKGIPEEFIKYFHYIRALQFTDKPNYDYLKSLLLNVWKREDSADISTTSIDWNKAKNNNDDEIAPKGIIKMDMLKPRQTK